MDIYFLDTSALINDTELLNKTYGLLLIHNIVLEELDKKSNKSGVVGKNARCVVDKLFQCSKSGNIHKGINLGNGIMLKIDSTKPREEYIDFGLEDKKNDNLLLAVYKEICEKYKEHNIYLYSGDKMMCIKAEDGNVKYIGKGVPSYNKKKDKYINQSKNYRNQ